MSRSQLIPHAQPEHKPDPKPDPDPDQERSQGNFQWEDKSLQKLDEWFQKDNERGIKERQELKEKLHDFEQKAIMYVCVFLCQPHGLCLQAPCLLYSNITCLQKTCAVKEKVRGI